MEKNAKIYIAGHNGLVGSAIYRKLAAEGYTNMLTCPRSQLDLTNQQQVADFLKRKDLNTFSWRPQRWAVYRPTIFSGRILFIKI